MVLHCVIIVLDVTGEGWHTYTETDPW